MRNPSVNCRCDALRERILELTGDELLMREESLRNVSSGKGKGEAAHY